MNEGRVLSSLLSSAPRSRLVHVLVPRLFTSFTTHIPPYPFSPRTVPFGRSPTAPRRRGNGKGEGNRRWDGGWNEETDSLPRLVPTRHLSLSLRFLTGMVSLPVFSLLPHSSHSYLVSSHPPSVVSVAYGPVPPATRTEDGRMWSEGNRRSTERNHTRQLENES